MDQRKCDYTSVVERQVYTTGWATDDPLHHVTLQAYNGRMSLFIDTHQVLAWLDDHCDSGHFKRLYASALGQSAANATIRNIVYQLLK